MITNDVRKLIQAIEKKRAQVRERTRLLDLKVAQALAGMAEAEDLWEHVGLPRDRTPTADEFAAATACHLWVD